MDSAKLLVSVPDEAFRESIGEIPAGVEFAVWDMRSGWERNEVLDIVVLPYQRELTSLPYLQKVRPRLIQTQTIGYDGFAALGLPFDRACWCGFSRKRGFQCQLRT